MRLFQRTDRVGLWANAVGAVVLAIGVNSGIFLSGWDEGYAVPEPWFAPPGWVIGVVWIFLFMAMGAARWLVLDYDAPRPSTLVTILILFCAAYPLYTLGLQLWPGLFGNIATICIAFAVGNRIRRNSKLAAALISLVIFWVTFATLIVLAELRLLG